jgi:hypothetical protein
VAPRGSASGTPQLPGRAREGRHPADRRAGRLAAKWKVETDFELPDSVSLTVYSIVSDLPAGTAAFPFAPFAPSRFHHDGVALTERHWGQPG